MDLTAGKSRGPRLEIFPVLFYTKEPERTLCPGRRVTIEMLKIP
jgi:hypothetical protein